MLQMSKATFSSCSEGVPDGHCNNPGYRKICCASCKGVQKMCVDESDKHAKADFGADGAPFGGTCSSLAKYTFKAHTCASFGKDVCCATCSNKTAAPTPQPSGQCADISDAKMLQMTKGTQHATQSSCSEGVPEGYCNSQGYKKVCCASCKGIQKMCVDRSDKYAKPDFGTDGVGAHGVTGSSWTPSLVQTGRIWWQGAPQSATL